MPQISILCRGVYVWDCFGPEVTVAFSGREIAKRNWKQLLDPLAISEKQLVLFKQEHTADVEVVKAGQVFDSRKPADGSVTAEPYFALGIKTADCVPVYFWDARTRTSGIAHAGWRGLHRGIIAEMMRRMKTEFFSNPEDVRAAIGPAIRECCYEVGREFTGYFPGYFVPLPGTGQAIQTKGRVNLIRIAQDQLVAAGVPRGNIYDSGICTSCQHDKFYSARRNNATEERILSVVKIRG